MKKLMKLSTSRPVLQVVLLYARRKIVLDKKITCTNKEPQI